MTKKLYEADSYRKEFDAVVLECREENGQYKVLLDQTSFFPEGGGQDGDMGRIGKAQVQDTKEKEGLIWHKTDIPLEKGQKVHGEIDYKVRFDRMQQHSGEHLVSGLIKSLHGYDNKGFHLGGKITTVDVNGLLSEEDLRKVEYLANVGVGENKKINTLFPDDKDLNKLDYRSKIEIEGQVRIIEVEGYDLCACCAPHLSYTGEIGMVKIVGAQKYKGGMRLEMICGLRALEDYNQKEKSVGQISVLLSEKQENVAQAVAHLKEEVFTLKGQLMEAQKELVQMKISQIPEDAENICLFEDGLDGGSMREFVNLGMERCRGAAGVFVQGEDGSYRYVIGSKNKDVREYASLFREKFGGKGGGQPGMIQGAVSAGRKEIEHIFE